jgi:branched-chain amino acid transport system ATP-binding protein
MLKVRNLHAHYGQAHILRGIDLEIGEGEVLVLVGRNGAGKSTTLKTLIGLVRPTSGEIIFNNTETASLPPYEIARLGLGYVPEERRIFTDLTVAENLEVGRQPPRGTRPAWTPERLFTLFPNLARMGTRASGRMSGGEQQMLTIARTLMGNPSLILLDEPSEGLSPLIVEQMSAAILALKAEGVSILLAEQNLHFAALLADRAAVIETGRTVWSGPMATLMQDDATRMAYLAV